MIRFSHRHTNPTEKTRVPAIIKRKTQPTTDETKWLASNYKYMYHFKGYIDFSTMFNVSFLCINTKLFEGTGQVVGKMLLLATSSLQPPPSPPTEASAIHLGERLMDPEVASGD